MSDDRVTARGMGSREDDRHPNSPLISEADRTFASSLQKRPEKGFTLVELLTVAIILLVLAAIVLPTYQEAKAKEAAHTCLDRMTAIGKDLELYANDFDDTLPMARYDRGTKSTFNPGAPSIWADLVESYAPYRLTFVCPKDPTAQGLSYALNSYFYHQPGVNRETSSGGSLGEIPEKSSKILLAESSRSKPLFRPDWGGEDIWSRHLGQANWIYGDLHAEHHSMPAAWNTIPAPDWNDPAKAVTHPYPQLFPWLKDSTERWDANP